MRDYIEQVLTNSLTPSYTELTVPVVFNSFYSSTLITQSDIDIVLERWNTEFEDIETSFIQCGAIKYFEPNYTGFPSFTQLTTHSYTSNALNVYVGPNTGSMARMPNIFSNSAEDNVITFSYSDITDLGDQSIIHEMGHSFGLFHTQHEGNNIPDDPYDTSGDPPRELVIRQFTEDKTYPEPNCDIAADLVCDTQANCDSSPNECTQTHQGNCVYTTDYIDPNGDPITPDTDNYMSYFDNTCRTTFTEGQKERMRSFKDHRAAQYVNYQSYCTATPNFTDFVEFEDTDEGMSNISVDMDIENVISTKGFTDAIGQFDLYGAGTANAILVRPGSGGSQLYDYTREDWVDGISVFDIVLIQQHTLGNMPLNGYQQIAADANDSGTSLFPNSAISVFDIVLITQLVLSNTNNLPRLSPWVFIPEYIPQDYTNNFHNNPFSIPELAFDPSHYPKYTGPIWEYAISNNGKAGFDAVKIGDVNGSNSEAGLLLDTENCKEVLKIDTKAIELKKEDILEIDVYADNFENIAGWQIGASFKEGLKVIAVKEGSLPDFDPTNVYHPEEEDIVRSLWFTKSEEALSMAHPDLFRVILEVTQDMETTVSDLMQLDNGVLPSRFYNFDGCVDYPDVYIEARINPNGITSRSSKQQQTVGLQIIPNPVKKEMQLLFDLPTSSEGIIQIQDAFGKVFLQKNENFVQGNNEIKIPVNTEWPNGLLFVTVQTKDASFTEKIVKLE